MAIRKVTIEIDGADSEEVLAELDDFVVNLANSYEASVQMWTLHEPAEEKVS